MGIDLFKLIVSALIAMLVTAPWVTMFRLKGKVGHNTENIIEEAKAAGRVATAHKVKEIPLQFTGDDYGTYLAHKNYKNIYSYNINGRKYKLTLLSEFRIPDEIPMYYPKGKPKKAVYEGQPDYTAKNHFFTLLPVVIWMLIYHLWN